MKLMHIIVYLMFVSNSSAQMHQHVLKIVNGVPEDYGIHKSSYLVMSEIEPLSKKTFHELSQDGIPPVIQTFSKLDTKRIVQLYTKQNFSDLCFKKDSTLDEIHNDFYYSREIKDEKGLPIESFALYTRNEAQIEGGPLMIRKWYGEYQPKEKKCCTPMRALFTGTTVVGLTTLALIFSNWQNIQKCCPQ
ncbi:MAG TPA: hypothetical protein VHO47_05115 [Candidatus Babeliales bacterium]|nr:hypothetical protein [Candidatus Babeliales bacterium]